MRSPLESAEMLTLDEVASTQDVAAHLLTLHDPDSVPGVVFAHHQVHGRGRFGRIWASQAGESLTMSLLFRVYADHPRPYLIGMTVAVAAASVLECDLAWPNDLMLGGRKVGGILTELLPDAEGRSVPVVGIGINLNQKAFPPEIEAAATSLALYRGGQQDPLEIARSILGRLEGLPEPGVWADLAPYWSLFDHTPGKSYRLPDGRQAVALGVGTEGQLICSVDGEVESVLAADALGF